MTSLESVTGVTPEERVGGMKNRQSSLFDALIKRIMGECEQQH